MLPRLPGIDHARPAYSSRQAYRVRMGEQAMQERQIVLLTLRGGGLT